MLHSLAQGKSDEIPGLLRESDSDLGSAGLLFEALSHVTPLACLYILCILPWRL